MVDERKAVESAMAAQERIANDFMKNPTRWNGPDCTANMRELERRNAAAKAATPVSEPDPLDSLDYFGLRQELVKARARIAELEKTLELAGTAPHLRGVEKRKKV